jgi:hypothetical protein
MGNRAYLSVYMPKERFSAEVMNYLGRVKEFYKKWDIMGENERNEVKASLESVAKEVFADCEYPEFFTILPTFSTLELPDGTYYCNENPFGEYKNSCMDKKDIVPLEWCFMFDDTDKLCNQTFDVGNEKRTYKVSKYMTTIENALKRIRILDRDSYLVRWISRYPSDALLVLDYGELFFNENFDEAVVVSAIASCGNCTKIS